MKNGKTSNKEVFFKDPHAHCTHKRWRIEIRVEIKIILFYIIALMYTKCIDIVVKIRQVQTVKFSPSNKRDTTNILRGRIVACRNTRRGEARCRSYSQEERKTSVL